MTDVQANDGRGEHASPLSRHYDQWLTQHETELATGWRRST